MSDALKDALKDEDTVNDKDIELGEKSKLKIDINDERDQIDNLIITMQLDFQKKEI